MTRPIYVGDLCPPITPPRRQRRNKRLTPDDLLRITPRGVRTAVQPLARGECVLEDLPDYALAWLQKHGAIEPAERAGVQWRQTRLFRNYIKRVAGQQR